MNIAIICEYNPMHFGHIYQINQIKKIYPDCNIIAVMSGNVVQRGEISILNKIYKTKMALDNLVDCVVEIPSVFSLQSAENFSLYSIKIVDKLGCDFVSFGIESAISDLISYKDFVVNNEENIKNYINLNKTNSFNRNIIDFARSNYADFSEDIFQSNNILAVEYMKALDKINSNCKILPIKRINSSYNSTNLDSVSFSSSSIRANIESIEQLCDKIPNQTLHYLKNNILKPNDKILELLFYKLIMEKSTFSKITGFEVGLDNLFLKSFDNGFENKENFFDNIKNKKYSKSRLKRLVLNYILGIEKKFVDKMLEKEIEAVRILGFNKDFNLSSISGDVVLYSIYRDLNKLSCDYKKLFEYDIKLSQLIYSKKQVDDFYDFPIIKK